MFAVGKLDSGDKELTLKLKSDLSDKERVIEECQDRIKSQSDEISQLKDQVIWPTRLSVIYLSTEDSRLIGCTYDWEDSRLYAAVKLKIIHVEFIR